jgi:hypothetical protein
MISDKHLDEKRSLREDVHCASAHQSGAAHLLSRAIQAAVLNN